MRLDELKARLIGKTLADINISVNEEMDAIQIHDFTFEDGTKVSVGANHSPVWIDYIIEPQDVFVTVSPDEADRVVEEDDDEGFVFPEPEPVVMLSEVLSDDEKAAVLAQCWMSGESILENAHVTATHEGEELPFRAMGGSGVQGSWSDPDDACRVEWARRRDEGSWEVPF